MPELGSDMPFNLNLHIFPPPPPSTGTAVVEFTSFLLIDVSLLILPLLYFRSRIIAQFRGLKEEHDSLHTFLHGRGGRFDQPGFCSYQ